MENKCQFAIYLFIFITIFAFLNQVDCLSKFKSKKYFNKNIASDVIVPDAQWYDQRLDHFDDSEVTTWKQV
jgi:hypothetical protein